MFTSAAEIIRRARGEIPQADLAVRVGVARETIARWEAGAQQPSLDALQAIVRATGGELCVKLVPAHEQLTPLVCAQLDKGPTERLRSVMGNDWAACRSALRAISGTHEHAVLVGPLAAALRGAPHKPQGPNADLLAPQQDLDRVERSLREQGAIRTGDHREETGVSTWDTELTSITLHSSAGAIDVTALRDRSPLVSMTEAGVPMLRVALVEDLRDLAEVTHALDAELLAGLQAVLASGRYSARMDRRA